MTDHLIPLTLHIGYPRTATTLLQECMEHKNPEVLFFGRRVKGPYRWSDNGMEEYWEWVKFGKSSIDLDLAKRHVKNCLRSAAETGIKAAMISDETLIKPLRVTGYDGLAKRLFTLFPDATILLTLRNQLDSVYSLYGLYVRREEKSIESFAEWILNGGSSNYVPVQERFNYFKLYSSLERQYKKEKVKFLFYEDFLSNPRRYLESMATILGIPNVVVDYSKVVNASDRRTGHRIEKWYRAIKKHSGKYQMSDEHKRVLSHLFYEGNDKLSSMADLDLSGRGYPTLDNLKEKHVFYKVD